eukprot:m.861019 g.861019  ORF g.861019 m.861019 type:complete len:476 (-) comp23529_c1_seq1:303-1730(-)
MEVDAKVVNVVGASSTCSVVDSENDSQSSENVDISAAEEYPGEGSRLAWGGFLMCGAGYLVPFNSYISAANFLEQRYEKYRPEFYLPLVYMYVTAPSVALNMVTLVDKFSIISRIRFGFALLLFSLAFFPITEALVTSGHLSRAGGYAAIVIGVGTTALGGGVQQSTLFGYAGAMGQSFSLAQMIGESAAGAAVSINLVISKAAYSDESVKGVEHSTFTSMYIAIAYMVSCVIISEMMYRTEFSRRKLACAGKRSGGDHGGVHAQSEEELELVTLSEAPLLSSTSPPPSPVRELRKPVEVSKKKVAWKMRTSLYSIGMTFAVTLLLFPGVITTPTSSQLGDWMPIAAITSFNVGDLIGKVLPLTSIPRFQPQQFSRSWLAKAVTARCVFIPLLIMTAAPLGNPVLKGAGWVLLLTLLMGVSGGFTAAVVMATAPEACPASEREVAGTIMTMALLVGLTVGATLAIGVSYMITATE